MKRKFKKRKGYSPKLEDWNWMSFEDNGMSYTFSELIYKRGKEKLRKFLEKCRALGINVWTNEFDYHDGDIICQVYRLDKYPVGLYLGQEYATHVSGFLVGRIKVYEWEKGAFINI